LYIHSILLCLNKAGLDELEFNYIRELAVAVRKHGLDLSELALHFRLYNYFLKSGAAEDRIESFIDNINSSNLPPKKSLSLYINYTRSQRQNLFRLIWCQDIYQGKIRTEAKD
jgi:hypothetical protein